MVRAAARGVIDYSQADPADAWWRRKHRWLLQEVAAQDDRDAELAELRRWAAAATTPKITDQSFDAAQANIKQALTAYFKLLYPWRAEEFDKASNSGGIDELLAYYEQEFGKPGEARYEEMVAELEKALQPVSFAEQLRRREKRKRDQMQKDSQKRL